MREKLLAAVRARTAETIKTGDSRPVLAPDALTQADALLARVMGPAADPDQPLDLEVLHAVGWLYWLRAQALPVDEFNDDIELATLVLQPVYASDPHAVPDLLRTFYDEQGQKKQEPPRRDKATQADPEAWTYQGCQLYDWYLDSGEIDALQAAIRLFRQVLAALPDKHPERSLGLANLHAAVFSLARRTGDIDAWREVVSLGHALLEVTPDDDPEYAEVCGDTSYALQSLFEYTGELVTLQAAVRLAKIAVTATPHDDPRRAARLSNLSTRLEMLFDQTGDAQTLQEAVEAGRAAVASVPPGGPGRAGCLGNLTSTLRVSFAQTGDLAVLQEAVAMGRAAVAASEDGDSDPVANLASLGGALQLLYEHTGDSDALREAITLGRAATVAAAPGHRHRAMVLANLGVALRELFDRVGDLDLLHEAVAAHRDALAATPGEHPKRASRLTNLGNTLRAVYERTGDLGALRDSVDASRSSVAATPQDHPMHAMVQANLAAGLYALFHLGQDLAPLRDGIAAGRAALRTTPADHPAHTRFLSNLGIGLHALASQTDDRDALQEAVAASRAAVAATPDHHPELADYLTSLGAVLRTAFEQTGDQQALLEARAALARAAGLPAAAITQRMTAGRMQARVTALAGDRTSALAAMEAVVDLLPQLASRELRRPDRAHLLGTETGIGASAAAAALSAGQPGRAVELLEQARGLLLAETMDTRTDHTRLQTHAPDLVDQFARLRDRLASLENTPSSGLRELTADPPGHENARRLAEQRREAAAEWNTLLEQIRARPGLGGFLSPPPIDRLRLQAEPGPVVIVNTDPSRCDALILTSEPDNPVRHVPLTGLTQAAAYQTAARFLTARRRATDADTSTTEREQAQAILHEILAWLWDTVTEPVLAALGHTTRPEAGQPWPRLWWCPVGAMALLPLHAAGHHHDIADGSAHPRTVLDRVISSYTATIRALAYARQTPSSPDLTTRRPMLIVAMPDTPGAAPLPGVSDETRRLSRLVPDATVLRGERATHDGVLAALSAHPVAHFACHGISEWAAPEMSRLLLHDHAGQPFTVSAISQLNLTDAELAYLSACSTTDTPPNLADEAIHITAAFQLAGYRNVIGTLWPVNDQAASRIAVDVYTHLTGHGSHAPGTSQPAVALHHAVRSLRDEQLAAATLWAAHIHTGR